MGATIYDICLMDGVAYCGKRNNDRNRCLNAAFRAFRSAPLFTHCGFKPVAGE